MARTKHKHIHYAPVIFCQGNTFPNEHKESDLAVLHNAVPQMAERNAEVIATALGNAKEKLREETKRAKKKENEAMKMLKEIGEEIAKRMTE